MIDETTKFNRAEGYYKRDASMGNVDGSWKNFVSMVQEPRNMYADGQLVKNTDNGSRPGYKGDPLDGYDRATRKLDKGVTKISSERVSSKIIKHIYLDKATGNEIEVFKVKITDQPSNKGGNMKAGKGGDYKTLLSEEFSTLEEAIQSRDNYFEENPSKRIKDPEKQKISKDDRRSNIKKNQGVESYKTSKQGSGVVKGHSGNIFGVNEIKPEEIIYTDETINSKMSNKDGVVDKDKPTKFDALDFEQRATESKIEEIKNSDMPEAKKKIELRKLDNKLIEITLQSDGYKTATLSDGSKFGTSFQSTKSMDMFSEFPGMNEKQVKEFVGEYFTQDGKLKPKYANAKDLPQSVQDNITKAYTFNENVKLAQQNAKNDIINLVKKNDPKLAKKVSIQLNSGIPIDQMLAEIKKIPGIKKLGKGFMKVGGPFEVAFFGLDTFNELSKGKTIKQSAKTALSNLTFGAYEGNKIEDINVLLNTAKNLNIDSTGFNELLELQYLEKELLTEKGNLQKTFQYGMDERSSKKYQDIVDKLQNEFDTKSAALQEKVDINSLVKNYTNTTKSLSEQQFDKSEKRLLNSPDPTSGVVGNAIYDIVDYKTYLPQNFLQNSITGVIPDILSKTPFVGKYFEPTSDRAKLFKMSKEDKEKRLGEKKNSVLEELQAPYYPKAEGGIIGLRSKYEYKK